jgi:predicted MFS family arabinose efflux permease
VLLVSFVLVELRQAVPTFDVRLFRVPTFAGAQIIAFSISSGMFSLFLYLTLYLQNVLGYSPIQAGLRFLPLSLLAFFVSPVAGRLSARLPMRLLLGGGLSLVAFALFLMSRVTTTSSWTVLLPGLLIAGVGIGMINPPLASTAVSVVEPRRAGMASGINNTFRQVGIATGIAALGAIFQHRIAHELHGAGSVKAVSSGAVRQGGAVARAAFISGLHEILLVAAVVSLAGAVLAFVLVRRRDFVASGPAAAHS